MWDLHDNETAFCYVIAIIYPDPFALEWIWKKTQPYLICRLLFADRCSVITAALQLCSVSTENAPESSYFFLFFATFGHKRIGTDVRGQRRCVCLHACALIDSVYLAVPACHYVQQRNRPPLSWNLLKHRLSVQGHQRIIFTQLWSKSALCLIRKKPQCPCWENSFIYWLIAALF